MKKFKKIIFCLFIFMISSTVLAKEEVTFSKCVDGDTIKVKVDGEEKTVRFLAVDTPESVHPTKGVEYYGKEASEYTCNKVTNAKKIELEYDDNSDKEDKYDRLLAWVWVDDSLLQDDLVSNGYAEVAYLYGDYKYTSLLQDHQAVAESKEIGIWNEEARNNFSSDSTTEETTSNETTTEDTFDIDNMSTKEIIVLIITLLIISIATSYIKKIKRKIKKIVK